MDTYMTYTGLDMGIGDMNLLEFRSKMDWIPNLIV